MEDIYEAIETTYGFKKGDLPPIGDSNSVWALPVNMGKDSALLVYVFQDFDNPEKEIGVVYHESLLNKFVWELLEEKVPGCITPTSPHLEFDLGEYSAEHYVKNIGTKTKVFSGIRYSEVQFEEGKLKGHEDVYEEAVRMKQIKYPDYSTHSHLALTHDGYVPHYTKGTVNGETLFIKVYYFRFRTEDTNNLYLEVVCNLIATTDNPQLLKRYKPFLLSTAHLLRSLEGKYRNARLKMDFMFEYKKIYNVEPTMYFNIDPTKLVELGAIKIQEKA